MSSRTLKDEIAALARAQGFDAVRFSDARAPMQNRSGLEAYLAAGHHGGMDWMEARKDERADPLTLWQGAKSVIMLGLNYGPERDPLAVLAQKDRGAISACAQGDDYHDLVMKKLRRWRGTFSRPIRRK